MLYGDTDLVKEPLETDAGLRARAPDVGPERLLPAAEEGMAGGCSEAKGDADRWADMQGCVFKAMMSIHNQRIPFL